MPINPPSGVYIRAQTPEGKWTSADALDLNDISFRRFVLQQLHRAGLVTVLIDEAEKSNSVFFQTEE